MCVKTCDLLEGLIPIREDKIVLTAAHLEKLFIFALLWSMGALMELDSRAKMEDFLKNHSSMLNYPRPGEGETMFEFVVDDRGTCSINKIHRTSVQQQQN